jgi:ornithine cyclodeaminase/alanine dehydrogenase-like protein (mu-crystallin family)
VLIIDEQTTQKVVGMADAIAAIEQAFLSLERGQADVFPVVLGHGGAPGTAAWSG